MANFCVTGGAGFIGSHLVDRLLRDGHRIRVVDDFSSGSESNLADARGRIELIQGDAADMSTMARALDGVHGVFHLAAMSSVARSLAEPLLCQRSGEVATLNVLTAARAAGVQRVVFSSSAAVYGDTGRPRNDETLPVRPLSFYAQGKAAGESYCRLFAVLHPQLDTVSLRYFNVFGPRQDPSNPYSGVISIFVRCLREGRAPTIFGDGLQTRDFVDVRDVVAANLLAMNAPQRLAGTTHNVGTGQAASLLALWAALEEAAGVRLAPQFAPGRPGDIRDSCAAIEKIRDELGYAPVVSWQEGVAKLWRELGGNRAPANDR